MPARRNTLSCDPQQQEYSLWDDVGSFVNDNTLTVYIKRLRSKLGDEEGKYIETIRGQGYRLNL